MRKSFLTICLLAAMLLSGFFTAAKAVNITQALASDKPFALLIYTEWTDYDAIYNNMKQLQKSFPDYNFVRVDLSDEEAKVLFNGYIVIKHLPMVLIGKQGGRFNQLIYNDCAADYACMAKKLKRFGH